MSVALPSLPSTVLVVEDDPWVRLDIAGEFARAGWVVIEATTGEEAVHFAGNGQQIDVVFTDIRLAGQLNGWDVGEAFRAADATMPVVYASGLPLHPMRNVSGSVYFAKPYNAAVVVKACAGLVRH